MDRFLLIFLIVTGILAGVAITVPGLILIGLFAFVLPGVILACAPTAFLYGLLFAIGWYLTRSRLGAWPASLVGLAVAGLVGWGVPQIVRQNADAALVEAAAHDLKPAAPIPLKGAVAYMIPPGSGGLVPVETSVPNRTYRPLCDDLCLTMLFAPGVTAVQPQPQFAGGRTVRETQYRLTQDGPCPSLPPAIPARSWATGRDPAGDAWLAMRIKLASGVCLVQEDADPGASPDMRLAVMESLPGPDRSAKWDLSSRIDTRQYVVAERDRVLARKTAITLSRITTPLYIDPGDLLANRSRVDWGRRRETRNGGVEANGLPGYVAAVTTLRPSTLGPDVPVALRTAIDGALGDPARSANDEAFRLMDAYLDILSRDGAREDDAVRVARIIGDPRAAEVTHITLAIKPLGPSAATLREPMVRRILASSEDQNGTARALGRALGLLPPETFRTLRAEERQILADPALRSRATGLICRLSDQGADAAEPLVDILAQAYAPPPKDKRRRGIDTETAEAAIKALSNLGPLAASALPRLEALARDGVITPIAQQRDDWTILLARLGKPVETFEKPENRSGTQEQYTARLRNDLARYVGKRCG